MGQKMQLLKQVLKQTCSLLGGREGTLLEVLSGSLAEALCPSINATS